MPGLNFNPDGSIAPFTPAQIAAMQIETLGIRDGSHPTQRREVNSSTIECEYLIEATQFENFVAYMLGGQTLYTKGFGPAATLALSRLMPQTWPEKPLFGAVSVPDAHGHVFLADNDLSASFPVPEYDRLRVKVLFQHLPFALQPDADTMDETERYVQTLPSTNQVDYLSLPGGVMKYAINPARWTPGRFPDRAPISYGIGFPLTQNTIQRKWVRLPYEAWFPESPLYNLVMGNVANTSPDLPGGVLPYLGSVNKEPFLGYDIGTLLLTTVTEELVLDPLGNDFAWNLTYSWLRKPQLHNYFYAYQTNAGVLSNDNGWYEATKTGDYFAPGSIPDGYPLFHERDHSDLFSVSG